MPSLSAKLVAEQWALRMGLAAGRRVASTLQVRGWFGSLVHELMRTAT